MLNGALKAARKAGAFNPERVWIVVVPVVVLLVLDRIAQYVLFLYPCTVFCESHAWLVSGDGPMLLRDAIVALGWALAAYTGVWALSAVLDYTRAVRRFGSRLRLPLRSMARLVLFGGLFLVSAYGAVTSQHLPTAEEVIDDARLLARSDTFYAYADAVQLNVPGIRELCMELRESELRPQRLMGAIGLWHLGDRSAESLSRIEVPDESDTGSWRYYYGRIVGRFR